jgi:hypothetical protein
VVLIVRYQSLLRFYGNMSQSEIAEQSGIS